MHTFTTERLLIRPLAEQEKAIYISLYTDAKIMRNIGEPLSVEAAKNAFDRVLKAMTKKQQKVITWAIVTLDNNECIGLQALNWQSSALAGLTETAEIGIMLLRNSNGKLLPEEAMGALMEYAFSHLAINTIHATYAKSNLATKRFVKKLGFTFKLDPKLGSKLDNTDNCYEYFQKEQWRKKIITKMGP